MKLLMTVVTMAVVAVAFRASMQTHATTTGGAAVVSAEPPRHTSTRRTPESSRASRPPAPSTRPTTAPTSSSAVPRKSVVVTGDVIDTQYGPVQVEVTVRGGRITAAHALRHPSGDGQTDQINADAVPQLDEETMAAQSAHIDTVSGATFTSEGYRQSLQAALDAAHQAGAR